jgi:Heparinase II/III N-terminus/Heparinase II/III-like protein
MFPFTKLQRALKRSWDLSHDTRESNGNSLIQNSFFNIRELDFSGLDIEALEYVSNKYLEHRFDLLGSGWERNTYSGSAPGLENHKYDHNLPVSECDTEGKWLSLVLRSEHLDKSKKIWTIITGDYEPIDWQKDIKSGFRWNAAKWFKDQRDKYYTGADLKMPWEIARFYHLPQLAIFAYRSADKRDSIIREFQNQVTDFNAANPPRMGINWTSTMEVAIRAVNLLIAYDFFRQIDQNKILSNSFHQIFSDSIWEHGKHIFRNPDRRKKFSSNHYLSNLTGLIFISAYLPETDESRKWLHFSISELVNEISNQFLPDGGNFESSTGYHMLTSQFAILALAVIAGKEMINEIPREVKDKIFRIGIFAKSLLKPNGEIPQIGDNDSGRLIKLSPAGKFMTFSEAKKKYLHLQNNNNDSEKYWDENVLNHCPTLAYFDGISQMGEFNEYGNKFPLERSFTRGITRGFKLSKGTYPFITENIISKDNIGLNYQYHKDYQYHHKHEIEPDNKIALSLSHNLSHLFFPDTKLIIFRSDRLFLIINAMSNGQNGNGGHAHNDKLSFELNIDGKDIIVDPGTYLYTSLPERRNLFRSVKYHNTLVVENEEQNRWENSIMGLFRLENETTCQVVEIKDNSVILKLNYRDIEQVRIFEIGTENVIILDYSNKPFKSFFNRYNLYSNGYGKLMSLNL